MNKLRLYTGPTLVQDVANYLTDYFNTVTAGTEWVYILTTKTSADVLKQVNTRFSGFTYRDVQVLEQNCEICKRCGSVKPLDQSCGCFDNDSQ